MFVYLANGGVVCDFRRGCWEKCVSASCLAIVAVRLLMVVLGGLSKG